MSTANTTVRKRYFSCGVVDCGNTSYNSNYHFYGFPTANILYPHRALRRKVWLEAIRRQEPDGSPWNPTKNSRICSAHFVGGEKSENPLSPSHNPTIFPAVYKQKTTNLVATKERYVRRKKRLAPVTRTTPEKSKLPKLAEEVEKIWIKEEALPCDVALKCDAACRVDFLEYENPSKCHVFLCNRYISTGNYADVETQSNIPLPEAKQNLIATSLANKRDNATQVPDPFINTCNTGFHGYCHIKDDQQLLDIAGVKRDTFNKLLKILTKNVMKTDDRRITREENRLLMFLMKLKMGLTFSSLGILFGMSRFNVSRAFYKTQMYFDNNCKNSIAWPTKEHVDANYVRTFQKLIQQLMQQD